MANTEQVKLIQNGTELWNEWREKNREIEVDLRGAHLLGRRLKGADLFRADLSMANLANADLRGATLTGAHLLRANLKEAYLNRAELRSANIKGANLWKAVLIEAVLHGANLTETNLIEANLSDADLIGTNLAKADLTQADLRGAVLAFANLSGAILSDADLSGARIGWTTFGNNDLSTVKGLDTVIHDGPSIIGIDTLFKSDGRIPELFLRGAGVPEDFMTFIPSLVGRAIQFYSCFISYSHQDEAFSRRLHSRMREEGLRVWYAPEDMKAGRKLHEEVFSAIQIYDKLLLVLTEHSINSEWVMTEIRRAKKVEREERRRKLFPIRLVDFGTIQKWECFDADSGKDLAVEVREYYIPDFSDWKDPDAFETEFAKLVRDLKATDH